MKEFLKEKKCLASG